MTALLPPAVERRSFSEVRSNGRRLEGYAATFGSEARMGSIVETIAPGAFSSALAGDVLALLDHDTGKVLGRTRFDTLRLTEDSRGLAVSLDLPDTQAGRDALALAERGDLGGMSFGFTVPKGGESWAGERRTLRSIGLKEISGKANTTHATVASSSRSLAHGHDSTHRDLGRHRTAG